MIINFIESFNDNFKKEQPKLYKKLTKFNFWLFFGNGKMAYFCLSKKYNSL